MIGGALKPECPPPDARIHRLGDQRVARRAANSLPNTVGHTNEQHLRRRLRNGHERSHERRDAIAEHDERLSPARTIRPPATRELEERSRRLRRSLDGADKAGARAKHRREENREQRIDHLARHVSEKAHRREREHISPQSWACRVGHRVHYAGRLGASCATGCPAAIDNVCVLAPNRPAVSSLRCSCASGLRARASPQPTSAC